MVDFHGKLVGTKTIHTLHETSISHHRKRKIIFKIDIEVHVGKYSSPMDPMGIISNML